MFESLCPHRGASVPAEESDQPAPAERARRHRLEIAYLSGAVAVLIGWLIARPVSASAGAAFAINLGQPWQRTTARAVRETVDVEQVCRYCGAVRTVRETRDR